jgi:hypothetical protein
MEIWKSIESYEGIYEISNLGRVKSLERYRKGKKNKDTIVKEKILKNGIRAGYLCVELNKSGDAKKFNIHRLLAIHFIPNPNNLPIVEHLNDIKLDIRLENLIWSTYKSNNNRAISNGNNKGCIGELQGRSVLTEKDIFIIRKIGKSKTQKEIAETYNVSRSNISAILRRKSWSHI